MVFAESIANPGTQIADLKGIGALCAERKVPFVLDNTLSTAWLAPGRHLQAGLVVSSLSKALAGHGNVLGGAVTDTGIFDWSDYQDIFPAYRLANTEQCSVMQIRK